VISASKQPISNRISRKNCDILDMNYLLGYPQRIGNPKGRPNVIGFAIQNLAPLRTKLPSFRCHQPTAETTGTLIRVTQVGAGVATIAAATGVSLNGVVGGSVALSAQWSGAALTKRGADAWIVQGALAGVVE
jgi:hypothetical protein